jgi:Tol biopolymer transport system component
MKLGTSAPVEKNIEGIYTTGASVEHDRQPMSDSGRYVVFDSEEEDLVEGDTNRKTDVFLYDSKTGKTRLVSVSSKGTQGNGGSYAPSISGNGRYVYYSSDATNLAGGKKRHGPAFYRYDTKSGVTERLRLGGIYARNRSDLVEAEGHGNVIQGVSGSGRYIVFTVPKNNVRKDGYGNYRGRYSECYRYDVKKRKLLRIPVPDTKEHTAGIQGISEVSISGDGRYIAFLSDSKDRNGDWGHSSVFVHDCKTNMTSMVSSVEYTKLPRSYDAWAHFSPRISPDGRYVAYAVADGIRNRYYVYLYDCAKKSRSMVASYKFHRKLYDGGLVGLDVDLCRPGPVLVSRRARYICVTVWRDHETHVSYRIKTGK